MATNQTSRWRTPLLHRFERLRQREDQIFLALALIIGAGTGLAVRGLHRADRAAGHAPHQLLGVVSLRDVLQSYGVRNDV